MTDVYKTHLQDLQNQLMISNQSEMDADRHKSISALALTTIAIEAIRAREILTEATEETREDNAKRRKKYARRYARLRKRFAIGDRVYGPTDYHGKIKGRVVRVLDRHAIVDGDDGETYSIDLDELSKDSRHAKHLLEDELALKAHLSTFEHEILGFFSRVVLPCTYNPGFTTVRGWTFALHYDVIEDERKWLLEVTTAPKHHERDELDAVFVWWVTAYLYALTNPNQTPEEDIKKIVTTIRNEGLEPGNRSDPFSILLVSWMGPRVIAFQPNA